MRYESSQYKITISNDVTSESENGEISESRDENMSDNNIVSNISNSDNNIASNIWNDDFIASNCRDNHGNSTKRKADVVNQYLKSGKTTTRCQMPCPLTS